MQTGILIGTISPGQGNSKKIQETKTVSPADVLQTVEPDEGYDALARIVVKSIPSNYGHIAYDGSTIRVY